MAIEKERKFLVAGEGWRNSTDEGTEIYQGYLCRGSRHVVRIRMAGALAYLTLKSNLAAESRLEFEYPIPSQDAKDLLTSLPESDIITKTRYEISHAARLWTVDVFHGIHAGLVLAEVELHDDSPLEIPSWIGREVTGDSDYYNTTLRVTTPCVTTTGSKRQENEPL